MQPPLERQEENNVNMPVINIRKALPRACARAGWLLYHNQSFQATSPQLLSCLTISEPRPLFSFLKWFLNITSDLKEGGRET